MKVPDLNNEDTLLSVNGDAIKLTSVGDRDVSQTQVIKLQKIARSKIEAIGDFATGLAHEINQPLTFINSVFDYFNNKMNKKQLDENRAQELINSAKNEIKRVSGILDDLYEFGEGNTGKLVRVNLRSVINQTLSIIKERMLTSAIEIDHNIPENLPDIKGDLPQIKQGLMYLFDNSLEALAQSSQDNKRITIEAMASYDGRFIVIKIGNNGPKIPQDVVGKIFDPFFTTKEGPQHTGMGLPILYSIIRNHGGIIHCVSNDNSKVAFELTLPVFKTRS